MDPNAGVRGDRQDFHAFEHRAPEPGELAGDPALAPRGPAGRLLLDEFDAAEILPVGEGEDAGPVR